MDWRDYIERKQGVMLGKPVFVGTRITVEHVLRELGGGTTEAELLAGHEPLTVEHLRAALLYAADAASAAPASLPSRHLVRRRTIAELVGEMTPESRDPEADWGPPVGREVW